MTKTFEEVRKFNVAVDQLIKRSPELLQTKFGYAVRKVKEREIEKIIKEYRNAYSDLYFNNVERAYIDNALTDKITGALIESPKGSARPYTYDKNGLYKVIEAERSFKTTEENLLAEWDKKEFDINPYIAAVVPPELTDEEKETFAGFVTE